MFSNCSRHMNPGVPRPRTWNRAIGNWLSNLQRLDVKNYLPLDILTKVDRMSMAHSIETRVPLLDHKLVEFAATIPPEMNLRGGTTKYVLKQAMRGILPDGIIDRPKHGFAVPLGYWFRGKLGAYVRDLLLGESAVRRGFFNGRYIEDLVAQHERGRESRPAALDSDFVRALGQSVPGSRGQETGLRGGLNGANHAVKENQAAARC